MSLGLDEAGSRRLVSHVGIAGRTQQVQTTVHLFFVVQVLVSVDRQERTVTCAPAPNDVAPVVPAIGHDVTI